MNDKLLSLIKNFNIAGKPLEASPFGSGHINKTFRVVTDKEEYVLQQINNIAFKDVDGLMNNINIVTSFIRKQGEQSLEIVPTKDNKLFTYYEGAYYRVYKYVKNNICYQTVGDNLSLAYKLGVAFGKFHHLLAKLDASLLKETIADFHNTPKRFNDFINAYSRSDIKKKDIAKKEIIFYLEQKDNLSKIVDGLNSGEIKFHTTHNDPKINNILFNKKDGSVKCVIDLDTVMPGSALYDFGDALRSLFTGDLEDSEELNKLVVQKDIYEAYLSGYYSKMRGSLNKYEEELLPMSIYIITMELAIRFLEDYLNGDVYFATSKPKHNLLRARTQIALAKDIEKHMDELKEITNRIINNR